MAFRFSQALTQKSNWSFSIPRAQLQITTNVITSKRCALKILTKTVSLSSGTAPTYRGNNIIRSSSRLLLSESGDPLYSLGSDLKVHEEGQKIPTNWKRFRHKLFNLIPVWAYASEQERALLKEWIRNSTGGNSVCYNESKATCLHEVHTYWHKVLCLFIAVRRRSYSNKTPQTFVYRFLVPRTRIDNQL